jgi:phage recombination protein Bet
MSNELVKIEFTDEQVSLIKSQIAPKATTDELKLFLYQARRTGLDPLARQIYCLPIGGKMSIQTSIDGFRVVAERSGDYAGQDEPDFIEKDGKLDCAKVRVYRWKGGQRYLAAVGVAYMAEYRQSSPMWTKMPHTMLSKCAEALALRKAYPQDLSGIYTGDEMAQAETQDTPHTEVWQATEAQWDEARGLIDNSTLAENDRIVASNSLTNATTQGAWDKLTTRLRKLQTVTP